MTYLDLIPDRYCGMRLPIESDGFKEIQQTYSWNDEARRRLSGPGGRNWLEYYVKEGGGIDYHICISIKINKYPCLVYLWACSNDECIIFKSIRFDDGPEFQHITLHTDIKGRKFISITT